MSGRKVDIFFLRATTYNLALNHNFTLSFNQEIKTRTLNSKCNLILYFCECLFHFFSIKLCIIQGHSFMSHPIIPYSYLSKLFEFCALNSK